MEYFSASFYCGQKHPEHSGVCSISPFMDHLHLLSSLFPFSELNSWSGSAISYHLRQATSQLGALLLPL